jgi:carboxylesterase
VPLMPGAEPFAHDGGSVGALVLHGFTGSPRSVRPWGEALADAGLSVRLPRLPGHGSTWQDMSVTRWADWLDAAGSAFDELTARCSDVFVMGLSMGGTLSLRLAELRGDAVSGLVLVNPSVHSESKALLALPLLMRVQASTKAIGNDIKKPGQDEGSYDRVPLRALHSLTRGWADVRGGIASVHQPLLLFHSAEDHVVEPSNAAWVLTHVSSADVEERVLPDSYHVATLDNDAPTILSGSLDFVRRLAPAAAGT